MSSSATASSPLPEYQLRSDLAQYCLPRANRDDARKLAWANSVCLMFVVVAIMGIKQPVFVLREPAPPAPLIPVELPPQTDQQPPPPTETQELAPEEAIDDLAPPQIVAPILVASPENVAFANPVDSTHVLVVRDVGRIPPPPAIIPKAPPPDNLPKPEFKAIRFGGKEFRKQPPPNYPDEFQRNRIGGTVEALIYVSTNGIPLKVEVGRSSGYPDLDRHVCEFIRKEWRAQAGEAVNYRIAITFAP